MPLYFLDVYQVAVTKLLYAVAKCPRLVAKCPHLVA